MMSGPTVMFTESKILAAARRGVRRQIAWLPGSSSSVWALVDQAIVSGTTFLTSLLIARALGVEEFGRFALAIVVAVIAQSLHSALITVPLMTIGPLKTSSRAIYAGAVIAQQAIFSLVAMLVSYIALSQAHFLVPTWQLDHLALPIALYISCTLFCELWRHLFYAFSNSRASALLDLGRCGLQTFLLIYYLWWRGTDVSGALYVMAFVAFLTAASAWSALKSLAWCKGTFWSVMEEHWHFSKWMLVSALTGSVRDGTIAFATVAMLGLTEVGFLRAAQQLVMAINVPLQGFGKIALARASLAYASSGWYGLVRFIREFVARYTLAIALSLLVLAFIGEWMIVTMYGPSYAGAGYLVSAYAAVMIVYLGRDALSIMVRAVQRPSWEAKSAIAGTVGSLALLLPLIHVLGVTGAIASEAVFNAILVIVMYRDLAKTFAGP